MKLRRQELLRSQCYADGKWMESADGRRITVVDPSTGTPIGSVPALGSKEIACRYPGRSSCLAGLAGLDRQRTGSPAAALV